MKQATGRRMQLGTMPSLRTDTPGGAPRFRDIRAMAEAAEAIGLDSFWLADHLIFRSPAGENIGTWEGFTFLSALAAATSRILLGPLVACTSFRSPALLAKMADSLDEISEGRFILGLGCGWNEPEYTMFDYPFDHRVARFEEALAIIGPLLKGEQVTFHGTYYHADAAVLDTAWPLALRATTLDRRHEAAHVAPHRALRRCLQHRPRALGRARAGACRARAPGVRGCGRDPQTLAFTSFANVHVLQSGETADPNAQGIIGTAEEVAAALREFEAAGVTHLIMRFTAPGAAAIERFAPVLALR